MYLGLVTNLVMMRGMLPQLLSSCTINIVIFMKIIAWNCHGAGNNIFLRNICEFIRIHNPLILVLFEPRVASIRGEAICRRTPLNRFEKIEAQGFSGGIWMF